MIRAAALAILIALPAQAGTPEQTYAAKVLDLQHVSAEAEVVGMCGIRSNAWVVSLTGNIAIAGPLMAQEMKIDANRANAIVQRAYDASRPKPPTQALCRSLVNSPLMDNLDYIQNRLSGGYH